MRLDCEAAGLSPDPGLSPNKARSSNQHGPASRRPVCVLKQLGPRARVLVETHRAAAGDRPAVHEAVAGLFAVDLAATAADRAHAVTRRHEVVDLDAEVRPDPT